MAQNDRLEMKAKQLGTAGYTTTGAKDTVFAPWGTNKTFEVSVAGTGAVSATVVVEESVSGNYWGTVANITLSGTGSDSAFFSVGNASAFYRLNITAISGTGATVRGYVSANGTGR